MSHFPTADPSEADPKTSVTAVLALVISLIGCCLPAGPLGILLGLLGLLKVRRSTGRLGGKGLAVAAIIIGVFNTLLWIGILYSSVGWHRSVFLFGDRAGVFLTHTEQGEFDEARALLTGPLATADDSTFAAFSAAVRADLGDFVSSPDTVGELWSGWIAMDNTLKQNRVLMSVPVVQEFENGRAIVQYIMDPTRPIGKINMMRDLKITTRDGQNYRLSEFFEAAAPPPSPPDDADDTPDEGP